MFETFIVQPLFNLLMAIYAILPFSDFGVAIIIMTIIIRLLMWPLVKKQLHQTLAINKLKPQVKKIKAASNTRDEADRLVAELYKEKGVNPVASLGILFIQIPLLIGLFAAVTAFAEPPKLINLPYAQVETLERTEEIQSNVTAQTNTLLAETNSDLVTTENLNSKSPADVNSFYEEITDADVSIDGPFFDQSFFGIFDLSKTAVNSEGIYWPLIFIAFFAGFFQYFQSRQLQPNREQAEKLRSIFNIKKEATTFRKQDFAFPAVTFIFACTFPGALALYWTMGSAFAVVQQHIILNKDIKALTESA